MGLSSDVNLPIDQVPVYPDRCVACPASSPTETLEVTTHAIGWPTLAMRSGKKFSASVPVSASCAPRLRRRQWLVSGLTWTFAIVGVALGFWLFGQYAGFARKWRIVLVALVSFAPMIAWQVIWAAPVELTAFKQTVDYEFGDSEYAEAFAQLNNGAVQ